MELSYICANEDSTIEWCVQHKLLPSINEIQYCTACKNQKKIKPPLLFKRKNGNSFGIFRCQKIKNHKDKKLYKISALKNTMFKNFKIEFQLALILTYCFVKKMTYDETIEQNSVKQISKVFTFSSTVCDWFAFCRDVCMDALHKEYQENDKIGGPGKIVEIDESKVSALNSNFK